MKDTSQASWEYLMPHKQEIMAGYIRESNETLADSTTIESAAQAVRDHGKRQGYIYPPHLEFKEAISAFQVPYFKRKRLMDMLEAAKRHEFHVLVIPEVRALSRRGAAEVLLIYQALLDSGVRLETIHEKFADDPMGELALTGKATFARVERETSWLRIERGKLSRIEIGQAPSSCTKAPYGYIFIDTVREVKGAYAFNYTVVWVDPDGNEWSEYKVACFIFDLLADGESFHGVARILNEMGIPPRSAAKNGEPHWRATAIRNMVDNPIYRGEVWAHRFTKVTKDGKKLTLERPRSDWIRLPDAPAIVSEEKFARIVFHRAANKNESMRNNQHETEELGLVRNGYCRCMICGRTMILDYPSEAARLKNTQPAYRCQQRASKHQGILHNHNTYILLHRVDYAVREKIRETLLDVSWVRARVDELRKENKQVVNPDEVHARLAQLQSELDNLFDLARYATKEETRQKLGLQMQDIERQQREAEGLLYDIEGEAEERAKIEKEIVRFEKWAEDVRPNLTDPNYLHNKATYEELRLAVRILGIVVRCYPVKGDWPFPFDIQVKAPEILAQVTGDHSVPSQPSASSPVSSRLFGPRVAR
jgi:Recombinase/Resolvase, N terminal domain